MHPRGPEDCRISPAKCCTEDARDEPPDGFAYADREHEAQDETERSGPQGPEDPARQRALHPGTQANPRGIALPATRGFRQSAS